MKIILLLTVVIGFTSVAHADCASELKAQISYAYNEGGLQIKNIVGPIAWIESVTTSENSALASKVAYAVNYANDTEVNPGPKEGNVLIIAQCDYSIPSRALDTDRDGVFTLADTVTRGLE